MPPIKVLLVEDEPIIAQDLRDILEQRDYEVIGVAASVPQALTLLAQHPCDVVLIDVMLRGERDGIDLAQLLRVQYPAVPFLFVTSLSDAATVARAKAALPHGYVVKPFEEPDVYVALEMALAKHAAEQHAAEQHGSSDATPAPTADGLFVRSGRSLVKIPLHDLLWLQADGNYTALHTSTSKYMVYKVLREVEEKLPPHEFSRVHRSYSVALRHVVSVGAEGVVLSNGKVVPVGRAYYAALLSQLNLIDNLPDA